MGSEVRFWFSPSSETVFLFFVSTISLAVVVLSVRYFYHRLLRKRHEQELQDTLEKFDLAGRPEEDVLRDLVERYRIHPPAGVIANLQAFDQLASEEIGRVERDRMPLADRIDRIEYLYSIRLQAFGHDPAVGGVEVLFPNRPVEPVPIRPQEPTRETLGEALPDPEPAGPQPEETEIVSNEDSPAEIPEPEAPTGSEDAEDSLNLEGDSDLARLLASPEVSEEPEDAPNSESK